MPLRLEHDELVDWQAFLGDQPYSCRRDVDQGALQLAFPIALKDYFGRRLDPKTYFTPKIHWNSRHPRFRDVDRPRIVFVRYGIAALSTKIFALRPDPARRSKAHRDAF